MWPRPGQLNPKLEPLWQQGDILTIVRADATETIQVLQVQQLPAVQYDGGSLSTASSLDLAPTEIELGATELGQFRFVIRDAFTVDIKHPEGVVQYWRGRTGQYRVQPWLLDQDTPEELKLWMWAASEFFVWSDRAPSFNCYKIGSAAAVELYLTFSGIKYVTRVLSDAEVADLLKKAEAGQVDLPETLWIDGLAQAGSGKGA